jgi:hypothetical protein
VTVGSGARRGVGSHSSLVPVLVLIAIAVWGFGPAATRHWDGREVGFDYPGSWHAAQFDQVSSFSSVLVYLSTEQPSDPCDRTASSVACTRSSVTHLGPNGVLITWTHWGLLGRTFDPTRGRSLTVGGRTATLEQSDASGSCLGIGGARQILVTVPIPDVIDNWIEVEACVAGPDPSAAQAQIEAMLASVRWK